MKQWSEILKHLTMFTQLGLSLVTPILICLGICWLITHYTGAGMWVYIPGFFFGLGGSITFALNFYRTVMNREEKESRKRNRGKSFNKH